MDRKLASLTFILLLFVPAISNASEFKIVSPYVGVEYKHQSMRGQGDWRGVVNNKYRSGGALIGLKMYDDFGFEFGYNRSKNETSERTLAAGDSAIGTTLTAGQSASLKTRVKVDSYHLDLKGFWPMHEAGNNSFNLIGTLGLGFVKARIFDNGSTSTPASIANDVASAQTERRLVGRVGFGAEYKYKQLGLRGNLLWEGTKRLKLKNVSSSVPKRHFRNSYSGAVGLVFYFS